MAAGAQGALHEEAKAISSAKQDVHRRVIRGALRKPALYGKGKQETAVSSAFSPSTRTEQVSQALIITHCSLEFPSPCFLNRELPLQPQAEVS